MEERESYGKESLLEEDFPPEHRLCELEYLGEMAKLWAGAIIYEAPHYGVYRQMIRRCEQHELPCFAYIYPLRSRGGHDDR